MQACPSVASPIKKELFVFDQSQEQSTPLLIADQFFCSARGRRPFNFRRPRDTQDTRTCLGLLRGREGGQCQYNAGTKLHRADNGTSKLSLACASIQNDWNFNHFGDRAASPLEV